MIQAIQAYPKVLSLFLMLPLAVGCATHDSLSKDSRDSGGIYYEASYQDHNSPPKKLTPPEDIENQESFKNRNMADSHYAIAESLSLEGQHQKAIQYFKLAEIYDPESAQISMRLSAEYAKLDLLNESMEHAQKAVKKNPYMVDARILWAGLLSTTKAYPQAIEQYQEVLKLQPNNIEAPLFMGAVYAEQKQYAKAIESFRRLESNPDYPQLYMLYFYMARIYQEIKTPESDKKCAEYYQKAMKEKPDFAEATLQYASYLILNHKTQPAEVVLEKYQRQYGPHVRIAELLSQIYLDQEKYDLAMEQMSFMENTQDPQGLQTKLKMALLSIERKKYDFAVQKLSEILQVVPESDKVRYYLAAVYEEQKQSELAIQHYRKISSTSQFFGDAVVHGAFLMKQNRQTDDAMKWVEQAISVRKDLPQLFTIYASLLDEKKDDQKTLMVLQDAVKSFPENVALRFFLGTVIDRNGPKAEVISQMEKVVSLDPNHVQGLNYLAFTLAEQGQRLDDAEKLASRALELDPNDGYVLDTFGWIMFKRGRLTEAIKLLEKAHRFQPQESVIADHLGDAYLKYKLVDKAKMMFQKAYKIEPDEKRQQEIQSKITSIDHQKIFQNGKSQRLPASQPQK